MSQTAKQVWGGRSTPALEEDDLRYFCDAIERRAGIFLKSSKHDLVRTRLRSRVAANNLQTYQEYREFLQGLRNDDPEWEAFTNHLTTNKTDFFREPQHFDHLAQTILPEWLNTGAKTFHVWSAAASTGEEIYTLAMVLDRHLPNNRDFRILGTDIDTDVLRVAQNAVYSTSKKNEIPLEYQPACLDFGKNDAHGWFRIKPRLKGKIAFKQHNLMDRTSQGENAFDLVLCRNVLIYFAPERIDFVQRKLFATVKPDGHLFIGHSESFQGLSHRWTPVRPSIFKKAP